ncbi:hypothetical protein [Carboxylicivirga sp. RSCT41]|uniref:hypothetical protein n=1 Tax=Carboxylicivirga agarovorans TaxID=3417570 RepID=UPI003D34682E
MTKKLYLLAVALFLISSIVTANNPVKKRQVNQQARINNGIATGELTKAETIQLQKQQIHINRTKKAARADGVVTKKERAVIQHKQNKASANIYRKKHNKISR